MKRLRVVSMGFVAVIICAGAAFAQAQMAEDRQSSGASGLFYRGLLNGDCVGGVRYRAVARGGCRLRRNGEESGGGRRDSNGNDFGIGVHRDPSTVYARRGICEGRILVEHF